MNDISNDSMFLPATHPQCGSCLWYRSIPNNLKVGFCTRFPPVAQPLPGPNGTVITWADFPPVKREQSCGEFKPNLKAMT